MRLHRFIGDFDLAKKELMITDREIVSQWRTVLRLKVGDTVIISDGNGREAQAVITDLGKNEATVQIGKVEIPEREGRKKAQLFCALLKRENFEIVAQKATEIGIARIVPLLTERTVKTGFNRSRLEKIIKEAAEQSGRTTLPELSSPVSFDAALEMTSPNETVLFDLSGSELKSFVALKLQSFFVGPEGGFTQEEVAHAKAAGISIASLGTLTLRGETAAIVASFLATR